MSLRLRLIGLVAIVLVISLVLGGVIACFNASGSVGTEMRSALLLGRGVVENAAGGIGATGHPRRDLERLVAVLAGDRHLRASLAGIRRLPRCRLSRSRRSASPRHGSSG